jgi:FKBP-type peptidyl-prolyl cis-trans isomerase FkpA
MKYIFIILALAVAVNASAQNDMQRTPAGASYRIFTHNTGDKIKVSDVITFQFVQKTDKDSILASSFIAGNPGKAQVLLADTVKDYVEKNLMQVFPLLTLHDSVEVKVPSDSIFKKIEAQRPPFLPKGSNLVFEFRMDRVQSEQDARAEVQAEMEKARAALAKAQTDEPVEAAKYITAHKLVLKTTASGLKYVITKPSLKPKPLIGDTLLVNYTGRTLDDKVFDSSIEANAKAANLNQPGRTYEPLQFVIGKDAIIQGWVEGLQLVGEGGKATLVIPSSLAYADRPPSDDIKPYSTLVFDVELVKIKPGKHDIAKKTSANATPPSISELEANAATGATVKIASMRATPSSAGKVIKQLPLNTKLYVIPGKDVSGYCKVIDPKTNKTGWVSKAAVKLADKTKK